MAWVLQNYSHTNTVPVSELLQHLQQEVQVGPLLLKHCFPLVSLAVRLAQPQGYMAWACLWRPPALLVHTVMPMCLAVCADRRVQ